METDPCSARRQLRENVRAKQSNYEARNARAITERIVISLNMCIRSKTTNYHTTIYYEPADALRQGALNKVNL